MRTNKVQAIGELDGDMHYTLPATEDKDIDLSMLTAVLCSAEQVGALGCAAGEPRLRGSRRE